MLETICLLAAQSSVVSWHIINKYLWTWSIDCKLSGYSLLCCLFFLQAEVTHDGRTWWVLIEMHLSLQEGPPLWCKSKFYLKENNLPNAFVCKHVYICFKAFSFLNPYFLLFAEEKKMFTGLRLKSIRMTDLI